MPKKKKDEPKDLPGALQDAGQTVKKVTDPFSKVMGAMDRAGRWLFGDPEKEKRKKRLEQAGQGGK